MIIFNIFNYSITIRNLKKERKTHDMDTQAYHRRLLKRRRIAREALERELCIHDSKGI